MFTFTSIRLSSPQDHHLSFTTQYLNSWRHSSCSIGHQDACLVRITRPEGRRVAHAQYRSSKLRSPSRHVVGYVKNRVAACLESALLTELHSLPQMHWLYRRWAQVGESQLESLCSRNTLLHTAQKTRGCATRTNTTTRSQHTRIRSFTVFTQCRLGVDSEH